MNRFITLIVALLLSNQFFFAQGTSASKRIKIDGVVSVIGDFVILESDVEKLKADIENQGGELGEISECQLLGKLMEDRLFAHHAVQDSLLVSDAEVNQMGDMQIQQLSRQIGSVEKVLEFYNKSYLQTFKDELYEINRLRMLADKMRSDIVD